MAFIATRLLRTSLWEELLARFDKVELVGEPKRVQSNFVMGYTDLPVVLHAKA